MAFSLSDSTANTQRMAIDNSANVELGTATPVSSLSVSGHPILNGSVLAQSTAAPQAMARVTGAVAVSSNSVTVTVSCPTAFGLSGVGGGGGVVGFNSSRNSFDLYSYESSATTLTYGVF
jgi:hypothetical protein